MALNRYSFRSSRRSPLAVLLPILALVLVIGALLFSGIKIYSILHDYKKAEKIYENISNSYVVTDGELPAGDGNGGGLPKWAQMAQVDFDGLREKSPDVAAWLYFEDQTISYPIMYSGDDEKYLYTASDGTKSPSGAIFLEGQNRSDFSDDYSIIFGHNMKNLSMFGKLRYYYEKDDYYETHKYFQILMPDKVIRYEIFAYEEVADNSPIYRLPNADKTAYALLLEKIRHQSAIKTDIEVDTSKQVVTLSTCTEGNGRFVVHGVKIAEAQKK